MEEKKGSIYSEEGYREEVLQYRTKGKEYEKQIDCWLAEKTGDSIRKFLELYQQEEFLTCYAARIEELSYGFFFAQITIDEIKNGHNGYFIINGNSLCALMEFYRDFRFLLWEVEFELVPEAWGKLKEFISGYNISVYAAHIAVETAGIDKKRLYLELTGIYLETGDMNAALKMLDYGAEHFPEEKAFVDTRAMLVAKRGLNE